MSAPLDPALKNQIAELDYDKLSTGKNSSVAQSVEAIGKFLSDKQIENADAGLCIQFGGSTPKMKAMFHKADQSFESFQLDLPSELTQKNLRGLYDIINTIALKASSMVGDIIVAAPPGVRPVNIKIPGYKAGDAYDIKLAATRSMSQAFRKAQQNQILRKQLSGGLQLKNDCRTLLESVLRSHKDKLNKGQNLAHIILGTGFNIAIGQGYDGNRSFASMVNLEAGHSAADLATAQQQSHTRPASHSPGPDDLGKPWLDMGNPNNAEPWFAGGNNEMGMRFRVNDMLAELATHEISSATASFLEANGLKDYDIDSSQLMHAFKTNRNLETNLGSEKRTCYISNRDMDEAYLEDDKFVTALYKDHARKLGARLGTLFAREINHTGNLGLITISGSHGAKGIYSNPEMREELAAAFNKTPVGKAHPLTADKVVIHTPDMDGGLDPVADRFCANVMQARQAMAN